MSEDDRLDEVEGLGQEEEPQIKLEQDFQASSLTSLTDPIPIAISQARESADEIRNWVDEIWGPAPPKQSEEKEHLITWFTRTFGLRDLYSAPRPGSRVQSEGFRGNVGDIRLQARAAAQESGQHRTDHLALLSTLAATIKRM